MRMIDENNNKKMKNKKWMLKINKMIDKDQVNSFVNFKSFV